MLPRTPNPLVFAGLSVFGLSLVVAPGTSRLVERVCHLYADPSQTPPDKPGGPWDEVASILKIDREIEIKNDLATNLLAGRRTLDEVTDDFLLLIQNRDVELTAIKSRYEGESDREKVARTVLQFARCQPGVSDESLARLEAEFHALFPRVAAPTANIAPATNHERSHSKQADLSGCFSGHKIVPVILCQ